jgi:hypothetical protein
LDYYYHKRIVSDLGKPLRLLNFLGNARDAWDRFGDRLLPERVLKTTVSFLAHQVYVGFITGGFFVAGVAFGTAVFPEGGELIGGVIGAEIGADLGDASADSIDHLLGCK